MSIRFLTLHPIENNHKMFPAHPRLSRVVFGVPEPDNDGAGGEESAGVVLAERDMVRERQIESQGKEGGFAAFRVGKGVFGKTTKKDHVFIGGLVTVERIAVLGSIAFSIFDDRLSSILRKSRFKCIRGELYAT